MNDIYPLTIVRDRYSGTYSGGMWTAWNEIFHLIPLEINEDDASCMHWWARFNSGEFYMTEFHERLCVGRGGTPDEAVKNLIENIYK